MSKRTKVIKAKYPKVFETYLPGSVENAGGYGQEPSSVNGVCVRRYRVTIEEIVDIEAEVTQLLKWWAECDNFHRFEGIRAALIERGVEANPKDRLTVGGVRFGERRERAK